MTPLSANSLRDTYTGTFVCREGSMSITAGECPQLVPLAGARQDAKLSPNSGGSVMM